MRYSIKNLAKLNQRLTEADFIAKPSGAFLRDWREDLRSEALDRAPKWLGGIHRALMSAQDTKKFPLWARVFSEAPEARWTEYGTGRLSEDPRSSRTAYFPPVDRIRPRSEDKGLDPYAVALGIFERGGTPPLRWFSDAERSADSRLNSKMMRFGKMIEAEAERG